MPAQATVMHVDPGFYAPRPVPSEVCLLAGVLSVAIQDAVLESGYEKYKAWRWLEAWEDCPMGAGWVVRHIRAWLDIDMDSDFMLERLHHLAILAEAQRAPIQTLLQRLNGNDPIGALAEVLT